MEKTNKTGLKIKGGKTRTGSQSFYERTSGNRAIPICLAEHKLLLKGLSQEMDLDFEDMHGQF
jgi:hypothetical protein